MNYIEELGRITIINDLSHYYNENEYIHLNDNELNTLFTKHVNNNGMEISMIDFYNLKEKNILIESLDGYVRVGEKIKKTNKVCYTLTLVDKRKISGAYNHKVETERGWVKLEDLTTKDYVLTIDGFIKVKNTRIIKTQDVYDLECLHPNHRYLSNGISNHNTGKSYYVVMFMDWFKKEFDRTATFDILTNSKILQEQYTKDFDFMNSLWGKGSYYCEQFQCSCETGMKMSKLTGIKCEECPYKEAKYKFDNGTVALSNFHLYLTYQIFVPQAWKRESRVLIIDEAHEFESVFSDFITTEMNQFLLKRNGFTDEEISKAMNLFRTDMTVVEFIDVLNNDLLHIANTVMHRLIRKFEDDEDIQAIDKAQSLERNISKWESLQEQYAQYPDNWIIEGEIKANLDKEGNIKEKYLDMKVQPVWAYPYLEQTIWSKYDYVIFMSGTILSKKLFSDMNGLDVSKTNYISLDSPFSIKNRPIYYFSKIGKQTYATKDVVWQKQLPTISKILKKHQNQKGIIHTTNYELQRWTRESLPKENRLLTHDTVDRNEVLESHYNTDEPTVLVSPSMMVGVDLYDDFSRFQIMVKMPYPNLGSKKIKKRMETMSEYYNMSTVRDIIQAYGRSIRSIDDYADTYILDACFSNLLERCPHYFPKWFRDAIIFVD